MPLASEPPAAPAPAKTEGPSPVNKPEVLLIKDTEWVRGKIKKDALGKKTLDTSKQSSDMYFYPKEEGENEPNFEFGVRQLLGKKDNSPTNFSFYVHRDSESLMGKNKSRDTDRTINIDVSTLRKDEKGDWIKPEKQKNGEQVPEKDWIVIKTYLDKMRDGLSGFNECLDESVKKPVLKNEDTRLVVAGKSLLQIAEEDGTHIPSRFERETDLPVQDGFIIEKPREQLTDLADQTLSEQTASTPEPSTPAPN